MQAGAKLLQRFRAIDGEIDQPSAAAEAGFEGGAHAGIVVGDEETLHSPAPVAAADAESEECSEEFPGACGDGSSGPCPALVPLLASPGVPGAALRGRRRRNLAP